MKEAIADKSIYLLAGPTASGKSAKALEWAQRTGGIIINADSMQLYEDVPTLTARPTQAEMGLCPHRLYGHLNPEQQWSVGEWVKAALPFIDAAQNGGAPVCIVGGTGLYFNALIFGLAHIPEVSQSIRNDAEMAYDQMGETAFREELRRHDPEAAIRISPNDRQRQTRAYSVWLQTGRSLSDWQAETTPILMPNSYDLEILSPDRAWLYARCDARLATMFDTMGFSEVDHLMQKGLSDDWPIMRVLGLRESVAFLKGEMPYNTALAHAQQMTRNYAKRQMTWFRNQFADHIA